MDGSYMCVTAYCDTHNWCEAHQTSTLNSIWVLPLIKFNLMVYSRDVTNKQILSQKRSEH